MARICAGNSGPALACAPADVPSARPDGMSGRSHRSAIIGLSPPQAIDEKIICQPSSRPRGTAIRYCAVTVWTFQMSRTALLRKICVPLRLVDAVHGRPETALYARNTC